MTYAERKARGYVMVACVPWVRRKGKLIRASKYGKRCFPIWRKTAKATP